MLLEDELVDLRDGRRDSSRQCGLATTLKINPR
jgi:hypothetical protein